MYAHIISHHQPHSLTSHQANKLQVVSNQFSTLPKVQYVPQIFVRTRNGQDPSSQHEARKSDPHHTSPVPRQPTPRHIARLVSSQYPSELCKVYYRQSPCRHLHDMNSRTRTGLSRLPNDILISWFNCIVTRPSVYAQTSLRVGGTRTCGAGIFCVPGKRGYSQVVREEGPLWDNKRKDTYSKEKDSSVLRSPYKMSRPEDHQATAAGMKSPPVPKPSSRCVVIPVHV